MGFIKFELVVYGAIVGLALYVLIAYALGYTDLKFEPG
jgi:hypothetical protein